MAKMTDTEKLNLLIRDDPEISGKMYARMKMHINEATVVDADQKWIPVTERLPNDNDFEEGKPTRCWIVRRRYNLLDIGKYEDIIEDAYWRGDGFINQSICFRLTLPHVSHWMPYTTPEPPKEDE